MALIRGPLIDVATFPTPHEAYGLCAVRLPQFKAAGLAVVFDHTAPTFYRVSRFEPKHRYHKKSIALTSAKAMLDHRRL